MKFIKMASTEEVELELGPRVSHIWIYRGSWEGPLQARKDQGKGHACLFGEWVGMLRGMWKKQSAWEEAEDRSGARPDRMRG